MTISRSLKVVFTPPSNAMRLSSERIKTLQAILESEFGLQYSDEQAQEAGMAIMRFVIAKLQRQRELNKNKENENE